MAKFIGGTPANTNGVTWVDLQAAPASGKAHQFLAVHVENLDDIDHTFQLRKLVAATPYQVYPEQLVPPGGKAQIIAACIVTDATDMKLQIRLAEAMNATQPRFDVAIFEAP